MFNANDISKNMEYRNQAMRDAAREQLASEARSSAETHFNIAETIHIHHRLVVVIILVTLFILSQLLIPRAADAHDTSESGEEPFAEAIQSYRVGHYYYVTGDYEKAIDHYQAAIESIPEKILTAQETFWGIYWELGNAQFKAGLPVDALESYKCFLKLMDDQASDKAIEFVDELETRITDGTYGTMTVLEG